MDIILQDSSDRKVCYKCKVSQVLIDFPRNRKFADERDPMCKACHRRRYYENKDKYRERKNTRGREYIRENLDVVRERRRDYFRRNPHKRSAYSRRANKKKSINLQLTEKLWKRICDFWGNRCLACGNTSSPLVRDHVIPVGLGGLDHITNIQPLCHDCNTQKGVLIRDYRNPTELAIFLRSILVQSINFD